MRKNASGSETKTASFFKVVIGDFEEKLKIPLAFIKNFKGKSLEKLILRNRVGRFWHVQVENIDDGLFFQNGWKAFVEENSLQIGDFLVFAYDGYSEFQIIIFGTNGSEKLGAPVYKKKKEDQLEERDICIKGTGSNGRVSVGMVTKMVFEAEFCPFKLKYPPFTASLKRMVRIPKIFLTECGPRTEVLTLSRGDSGKKLSQVQINYHKDGRAAFGAGWSHFQYMHNLTSGDKCLFEFIEQNVARVHVIQVMIFGTNGCEKLGAPVDKKKKEDQLEETENCIKGTGGCSCKFVPKVERAKLERENCIKGTGVCSCQFVPKVERAKLASPGKTNCGNVQSNGRVSVGMGTEMVFEAEFCPFKLKYPHFTASLKYKVRIPRIFLRECGPRTDVLTLCWGDSGKKLSQVQIGYGKDGRASFRAGWLHFRTTHNLRSGDKCVFEFIEQNVARVYVIQATTG